MSKAKPDFKRMLLQLPYNRRDYAAVTIIAELAELFGIDLVGTFVEDSDLRGLAELPNVREFRSGAWQPFSSGQLARDMAFAVREAERLFLENAGRHRSRLTFNLAKGADLREAGIGDIIVVIEPNSAIERATHQFAETLEAAFRSASSILLVPGHAKRRSGPIIAVISEPDDPGIAAALSLALSSKEQLILIPSRPSLLLTGALERARLAGVVASLGEAAFDDGNLLLPAWLKGRLLVMNRSQVVERPPFVQTPILLVSAATASQADISDPHPLG